MIRFEAEFAEFSGGKRFDGQIIEIHTGPRFSSDRTNADAGSPGRRYEVFESGEDLDSLGLNPGVKLEPLRIIGELNILVESANKAASSPALEKVNQLIADSMDKAGQEGEALIDLSFKRGVLLTLFAVAALFLAQLAFVYLKKRLKT